ncbi:pirin family protein [Acinetobacter sp. HY1485]|uniref:pirin family protein n=1 Tax=Acinetobacter sp. HY1485 TaxID=2970918 RepID=UPI0022B99C61|nr:pirin-like bicupin family protein [Acinetobacter sp. HY1485]
MKIYHHLNRGHVQTSWLDSYHSFSFGQWYDPSLLGVSSLRVINEDTIAPHQGFGTHPHKNMEILTYVLEGQLTHQDSMGNHGIIQAGEWQLMSAGSGVQHSEVNHTDQPVHLLQIWLHPNVSNAKPNYQQIQLNAKQLPNQWHLIIGLQAPMEIRQDATIRVNFLTQNQLTMIDATHGLSYVHIITGKISVDGEILHTGDAFEVSKLTQVQSLEDSHLLWFDLVHN